MIPGVTLGALDPGMCHPLILTVHIGKNAGMDQGVIKGRIKDFQLILGAAEDPDPRQNLLPRAARGGLHALEIPSRTFALKIETSVLDADIRNPHFRHNGLLSRGGKSEKSANAFPL